MVVLAILMILLALLMPNLRRGREIARRTACGSNLRQIMLAALNFEGDRGRLPSPNWGTDKDYGWLYAEGKMDRLEDLRAGSLWPYLRAERVYRCPSDQVDPAKVPNRPKNARMITSYLFNGSLCAYGKRPYLVEKIYLTYRSDEFKAMDVLLWEPDDLQAGGWWWDGSNFPHEGISARHFDRATAVCADGHVEWMTVTEWYQIVNSSQVPNRLWNVPWSTDGRTPQ